MAFEAQAEVLLNPVKQIQGGRLIWRAMLDECMSVACMVASGMTHVAPTVEMKTSFFRPGVLGPFAAVGRVIRWGKDDRLHRGGDLHDAEGRLLAKSSGTADADGVQDLQIAMEAGRA